jgi:integrase/recombinase XerD
VYLLGCLGLGSGEARSIQIEHFSETVRGHRVLAFVGRGGVAARIPLPVPVVRALDESAEGRNSGPLMLARDRRRPLSELSLRTLVRNMGVAAGISVRVHPHLLRVSCIINALDSGASLRKVQDLARHGQVVSTMRYDHDRRSHDAHAVHTLMAYLSTPENPRAATLDDHAPADGGEG